MVQIWSCTTPESGPIETFVLLRVESAFSAERNKKKGTISEVVGAGSQLSHFVSVSFYFHFIVFLDVNTAQSGRPISTCSFCGRGILLTSSLHGFPVP